MSIVERIHNDAMEHLSKARQSIKKLAACTADWSAGVMLEIEFDNVEEVCREFGECQFGMCSVPTYEKHEKTQKVPE